MTMGIIVIVSGTYMTMKDLWIHIC
jgi:hypothetical protein